jgi:hypothetical protein
MTIDLDLHRPQVFEVPSIGDSQLGYISVAEIEKSVPFDIKRIYWTYYTPQNVKRGYHSHKALYQMIFAVSGVIIFNTEDRYGNKVTFQLDQPNRGLFFPPLVWREIQFSHNAVLLCIASEVFDESDYIRDYDLFLKSIVGAEMRK